MRIRRGLALPALTEQHDVVAGEQGTLDLGDDGLVEADDARQDSARPSVSRAIRFCRISVLTLRCTCPDARRSPRVAIVGELTWTTLRRGW